MIAAIDTHCHINYGDKEQLTRNNLTKIMQEGDFYSAYPHVIKEVSEGAHIGTVFVSPFDGVLDSKRVEEANEDMLKIVAENELFYQWVVIDPRNDNTLAQAERILQSEKCVGIKLHPLCHGYSLEEWGDKVFSFSDRHCAVVQIHPTKGADEFIPFFANQYTKTRFIMAHLSGEKHINAVKRAKHGNVYVDTSGQASLKNLLIEYTVSQIGSERILFGTDTYSAAAQRGRIEFSTISSKDKENILCNNAKKLFDL